MAPRTGNSGRLTEKRRGDRVALFGEGSEEEAPDPPSSQAGVQAPRAGPTDAAARRRRPERARPQARGSVHPLGPAGVPAGRQAGSRAGPGRIWALATRAAVPRGSHASAAQPRASRPGPAACPPHLAEGRPPRVPPLRQTEKLPRLGREPGRAAGLGARPPGCAQEARAWGGSRRRGLLAAAPRPPLQEIRRLGRAAAGAHAQRPRRGSRPRPDSASRLRGNGPPQCFRTVTW